MRASLATAVYAVLLAASSAVAGDAAAGEEVVVIANKDNPQLIDRSYLVGIYTGRYKAWPDGSPVFTLDQSEHSPVREAFCVQFLGRTVVNMQAVWAQNIFSGRGLPPKIAAQDAEMKRIVSTNRHALGYIRASALDDSVRVMAR